jgi:hypothetical protein
MLFLSQTKKVVNSARLALSTVRGMGRFLAGEYRRQNESPRHAEPVGCGIPTDLVGEAAPIRVGVDDQQLGAHHLGEVS